MAQTSGGNRSLRRRKDTLDTGACSDDLDLTVPQDVNLQALNLGVQVLQDGAEVGREQVVARCRPLAPLDEGRPGRLQHIPVRMRTSCDTR